MCLGVPMQIVARGGRGAVCEGRGAREELDVALVGEQAPGTWVLASRGCAVRVLSALEAERIAAALDALEAVLAGEANVDAFFADLVERDQARRSPDLPEGAG